MGGPATCLVDTSGKAEGSVAARGRSLDSEIGEPGAALSRLWRFEIGAGRLTLRDQFLHRAIRLINCRIGVSTRARIGVRYKDAAERLSSQHPWLLTLRPIGIV